MKTPSDEAKALEEELFAQGFTRPVDGNFLYRSGENELVKWPANLDKACSHTHTVTLGTNGITVGNTTWTTGTTENIAIGSGATAVGTWTTTGNNVVVFGDDKARIASLENDLSGVRDAYNRLLEQNDSLKTKNDNQAITVNVLEGINAELKKKYNELLESHNALRQAIKEVPDSDETRDLVEGYRGAVANFKRIIDEKNRQIEALRRAQERVSVTTNGTDIYIVDKGQQKILKKICTLDETVGTDWDSLTIEQKLEKLKAGITVWSASSGEGPLRTIADTKIEIGGDGTFGIWCMNPRGIPQKYYVADLTPVKQTPVIRPSKFNLLATTLASTAFTSYAAYTAFGPKAAALAGVIQTVIMLLQIREYAKA